MPEDIITNIARNSTRILERMKADPVLKGYIATDRIPAVFMGADNPAEVRLIVIGQDPTVKNEAARGKIQTVLNLDKPHGRLYKYIDCICQHLGLDMHRHLYATNYAKYFFVRPPTQIQECDILAEAGKYWLPLLKEELALFPKQALVVSLGEPLLKALSFDPQRAKVRRYWGYTPDWKTAEARFSFVSEVDGRLGRRFYPLPHQPSLRKEFYNNRLDSYLAYARKALPSL